MSSPDPEQTHLDMSIDLVPNEPSEIEHPCVSCGSAGVLRLLIVPDMFFPDTLISTFACHSCPFRNKQMDEMDQSKKGVRISCHLNNNEDLKRYLLIPSKAKVSFEAGDDGVSYTNQEDTVTTVEALIRSIFEKLVSMGTLPEDKLTEEELAGLDEYANIAMFLQKSMDELDITLKIDDPKGLARVMPLGANMQTTTKGIPLEYYRDGVVEIDEYDIEDEVKEEAEQEDTKDENPDERSEVA
ncbi:zinc finger protein [Nematocida ausubeli]|nr:zinc finger protein [Nematocida ausubeli]KAI5146748.1 zinc finger protein [Nematocida ausubeli]KAI5146763.1 zinc finger protein [Nematocida ausubeli]KAI5160981.1 zinc finger protein [Nematocida ausubeli]KAI5161120.1 zinc finger protein [Nematocida ausubeli]